MRQLALSALLALAAVASGCGAGAGGAVHGRSATLVLDFTPNAVHTGIYAAIARGYDRDEGLRLRVIVPSASTDSIKLLEAGRVDFALLDIHDLAIARAHGADLVGIMAIVERPLAAVIAAPAIRTPRELSGKTVGITGAPSDTAVLDSVLTGSGANPHSVHTITIGFDAVADLLAGRVAGATAFWNDEGVTLAATGRGYHDFRVDSYGAPAYPELVLCTTARELRAEPGLARALVRSLVRGYDFARTDPRTAAGELEAQVTGLEPKLVSAQLAALEPAFSAPDGRVGVLDRAVLERWSQWEARFGIVSRPPNVAAMFDTRLVGS